MAGIWLAAVAAAVPAAVGLYIWYKQSSEHRPTQPEYQTNATAYRPSAASSSRYGGYESPSYSSYDYGSRSTNRASSTTSYITNTATSGKEYLTKLKSKAVEFIRDKRCYMKPISDMYRNLPADIFYKIRRHGTMTTRLKDNNGDPKSTINGKINGLFFMATHNKDGSRPPKSPFGDMRMVVPIENFFKGSCRLYFADMYCFGPNRPHYVTLVLTKQGSTADKHCSSYALELDLAENPFLKKLGSYGSYYCVSGGGLWVEVFYTENMSVNLPNLGWEMVETIDRERNTRSRVRKYPDCTMCNVGTSLGYNY